jgi:hypothetical protein
MARKKTSTDRIDRKASISQRLREIRQQLHGEHGGPEMARQLGLPARTWYNYESGVTIPAEVLLSFIDRTGANPAWLFSGLGPRFLRDPVVPDRIAPADLIRRCLDQLLVEDSRAANGGTDDEFAVPMRPNEWVELPLLNIEDLLDDELPRAHAPYRMPASRKWITRPESTFAIRMDDEEMEPVLPKGSILGIDRSARDPAELQGRLVVAKHQGKPLVRQLDLSNRHLILKASRPGRGSGLIALPWSETSPSPVLGRVVWSWTQFER